MDVERSAATYGNSAGILFAGQRMDLVLRPAANAPWGASAMTVELDRGYERLLIMLKQVLTDMSSCFKYENPALTPDQTFPIHSQNAVSQTSPLSEPNIRDNIDLEDMPSPSSILQHIPERADQTHVVYTKIQKKSMNHNIPQGFFNQTVWKPQQSPSAPLISLPRSQWNKNQLAISTGPEAVWIDLVVNNLDEGPHPFHLVTPPPPFLPFPQLSPNYSRT